MDLALWVAAGLLAAAALTVVGAMITHGSAGFAVLNLAYLAVAAFVAWGRFSDFTA